MVVPPPRKALCSIGHGRYEALLRHTAPTLMSYAARHGYDLVLRFAAPADERPVPWAKIALIRELLHSYDIVVWVDADAVIVDNALDLSAEVVPNHWMYLCRMATAEGLVPNTGVWMFVECPEARAFLDRVDSHRAFDHHPWWENGAVIDLLGYEFDPVRPGPPDEDVRGVRYLDTAWNSVTVAPAPNPRIKHYAGLPFNERLELMLADLGSLGNGPGLPVTVETSNFEIAGRRL